MKQRRTKAIITLALAVCMMVMVAMPAYADADGGGASGSGLSLVIPGVISTQTYTNEIAKGFGTDRPDIVEHGFPTQFPVQLVSTGVTIDLTGWTGARIYRLANDNGTLVHGLLYDGQSTDWSKRITENYVRSPIADDNTLQSGSFLRINEPGYYLIITTSPIQQVMAIQNDSHALPYRSRILNVVGASDTSTTSTPAATQDTAAPSVPSSENTVRVAEQNRTPGQIQAFRSGEHTGNYLYTVNHDDTLYGLANRFYGNGDLWKELQAANQTWLNDTRDGIIFVGFNLLIPSELGGVRANIR